MRPAVRAAAWAALAGALWVLPVHIERVLSLTPAAAHAADDWKKEFEEICAKTQDAMALPTEELRSLVARCDALKPAIEALDDSMRKVYTRRLKACRDLYQFVLEYREQGQG